MTALSDLFSSLYEIDAKEVPRVLAELLRILKERQAEVRVERGNDSTQPPSSSGPTDPGFGLTGTRQK